MEDIQPAIEPCYTVPQVAHLWHVTPILVRKIFRGRPGVMILGEGHKAQWRIPVSLVVEVMVEKGYDRKQAAQILKHLEYS